MLIVFSYRLKHSQPDFTILVLQGVGLLYHNTPLFSFLRKRIYLNPNNIQLNGPVKENSVSENS